MITAEVLQKHQCTFDKQAAEALLESMPDFLDTLFYICLLSFCSFFQFFFLSFIYFLTISFSISIHFKSQAWILKVSQVANTVVKKRKLTAWKLQNIFSLLIGVNSFLPHCIVVEVLRYIPLEMK